MGFQVGDRVVIEIYGGLKKIYGFEEIEGVVVEAETFDFGNGEFEHRVDTGNPNINFARSTRMRKVK